MERAAWTAPDEPTVGVVGLAEHSDGGDAVASGPAREALDRLESLLEDRGGRAVAGDAGAVLESDPSFVVAIGGSALGGVVRAAPPPSTPVLPVDAGPGVRSVPLEHLEASIRAVLADDATRREYAVLTVDGEDVGRERALFDATLVTDEPARISEYAVDSRGGRVEQFRADGVVVATPAGSHGYASAASGPLLSSAIDGVVVVPIAPFVTRTDRWVLPDDDVRLTVERDEGDVALCVDDVAVGTVTPGSTISVSVGADLPTLVVPESRRIFGSESDAVAVD